MAYRCGYRVAVLVLCGLACFGVSAQARADSAGDYVCQSEADVGKCCNANYSRNGVQSIGEFGTCRKLACTKTAPDQTTMDYECFACTPPVDAHVKLECEDPPSCALAGPAQRHRVFGWSLLAGGGLALVGFGRRRGTRRTARS